MIIEVITTLYTLSGVVVTDTDKDLLWEGLGGLDAVGGARLLFDYPDDVRSDIMDLLFAKQVGAQWQVLKQEINGDSQSSYGSGSSFEHVRNDTDPNRWNRGTHHLLLKEALKRNPEIPLYALSWGVPHWVGDGEFYSEDNVQYHIRYLEGMKKVFNADFNYMGIWNEVAYSADYIVMLRKALNEAGFEGVQIVASDQPNADIVETMLKNSSVMDAVAVVGVHGGEMDKPVEGISQLIADNGKRFWNSEDNTIDGAYPKWDGMALMWVRLQLRNYLSAQSTSTILCPLSHSWSMNYGRNNHGHSTFIEPWSGYYSLGAPFWTQAHLTHFTEVGRSASSQWFFLKNASHSISSISTNITGAVLYKPTTGDFTVVVVNEGKVGVNVTISLDGEFVKWKGGKLSQRQTTEGNWFMLLPDVEIPQSGDVVIVTLPNSVTTLSTLPSVNVPPPRVPERSQFPLPYNSNFQDRVLGSPGRYLSDQYGAFDVCQDPTDPSNNVLRQSAMANPGKNGWTHRVNLEPFTGLPSGTNWANYNISVRILFPDQSGLARVCGRVPLWSPQNAQSHVTSQLPLGVCLTIGYGGVWNLTSFQLGDAAPSLLQTGRTPSAITANTWFSASLLFTDDFVTLPEGYSASPISLQNRLFTGITGIGSSWGHVYFDDYSLELANGHPPSPKNSFLMDCLVGGVFGSQEFTGQVGMVVEALQDVHISQLGRFKVAGNKGVHKLSIISEDSNELLLTNETSVVDFGSCVSDLNGFCYTPPLTTAVKLLAGHRYFIVSSETAGGDRFLDMTNPATGTTMRDRDGTTYQTNRIPQHLSVVGKVLIDSTSPSNPKIETMIDVSYGPVNFVTVE